MKSGGQTFDALTSWRGICALAVALFHFPIVSLTRSVPLIANAYLFVDFFFVLSGFVIASAYEGRLGDNPSRIRFMVRRFGRLWPLHASTLAILVLVAIARHDLGVDEKHSVAAVFTNLALIHGLGVQRALTWNGPSWSISVEAFLYAAFLGLSFYRQRVAAYAILVAVGLVALSAWAPHGMASTFDFGAFRGLAGFFTGALLARLPARAPGAIVELSVVAIVAAFVSLGRMTILSPLVFALPVYVFAQSQGWVGHLLRGRAAVWLGERSYSIYMVHGVLLGLLFALADRLGLHRSAPILESPSAVRSVVILAGYVLSIIALSAVTYELIEQPGRAIFNRFAGIKPRIGESLAATS